MRRLQPRRMRGFTLIEVVVAATILCVVALVSIQAMLLSNRWAATSRLKTNARTVVQRNIDRALTLPFSASQVPALLAITSASGEVYDDDTTNNGLVEVMVQTAGGTVIVPGTLTRTVTAVTNTENADIRRVTFSVAYTYRNRSHTYQMETLRTRD